MNGPFEPRLDYASFSKEHLIGIIKEKEKRISQLEKITSDALPGNNFREENLIELVDAGVIVQSKTGEISFANRKACEIFKMTKDEVLGKYSIDPVWNMIDEKFNIVPGDEHPSMISIKTGQPLSNQVRGLFAKDNTLLKWLLIDTHPVLKNGVVEYVIITFNNITQRKNAELALKSQLLFNESIINTVNSIILGLDKNANIILFNEFAEKLTGYQQKEVLGKNWFEIFIPGEKKEAISDIFNGVWNGKELYWGNQNAIVCKNGNQRIIEWYNSRNLDTEGNILSILSIGHDITDKLAAEKKLRNLEWLLTKRIDETDLANPEYGDLTALNTNRTILNAVGKHTLEILVGDYLRWLDTSAAVYEINGDYALGIFASGYCKLLDKSSRHLCVDCNNNEALRSGKWLCHESCWSDASKKAIETGKPVDIDCNGGIRIYAMPVIANQKVIGAINFGYGNPPDDLETIKEIAHKYKIPLEDIIHEVRKYDKRPPYFVDLAKDRLKSTAALIGEIVERKNAQTQLTQTNIKFFEQNKELEALNEELRLTGEELLKTNRLLKDNEEKYRSLFENIHEAFALHEIVLDEQGKPVDFIYLAVNPAFESITRLKANEIINKKGTEVIPGLENKWINTYGEVAITGKSLTFTEHSVYLDKYWEIRAFSPAKNKFAVIFSDVTDKINSEKIIKQKSEEIQRINKELEIQVKNLKTAIKELKSSEARYRNLVETASDNIFMMDENGRLIDCNQKALSFFKVSKENIANYFISDIDPNFTLESFLAFWKDKPFEESFVFESTHRSTTGEEIPVEISAMKFCIDGKTLFYGIARDLKDRKKTEDELKAIFNMSLHMICIADINSATFLKINPAFTRILGYDESELISKSFLDFIHPDDIQPTIRVINNTLKKGKQVLSFENRYRCKDGTYKYLDWVSHPLREMGITYAIATDVTDKKKSEQLLIESENRLKLALESANEGMWIWDLKNKKVFFDKGILKMLGYSQHDFNWDDQSALALIHPDDYNDTLKSATAYINGELSRYDVEFRMKCNDGSYKWIWSVGKITQFDEAKNPLVFTGVHRDITPKKEIEQELKLYREHLERMVNERTSEIREKNEQLERMNKLFAGREFRIKELRDEVKELKRRLGE